MKYWLYSIVCFLFAVWIYTLTTNKSQQLATTLDLNSILGHQTGQGFARVEQPRRFRFPQDHYEHPEYRIEWWYLTGNLKTQDHRHYGYQITFFRTALQSSPPDRQSNWASNQIWMAHLAISDIQQQHHYQAQRLSRAAVGLAGIHQQPFKIWLEDWKITASAGGNFPWHITARDHQFSIDLTINPLKPVVLQGDHGLSQKSDEAGNASYYYSFTRLKTTGTITVNHIQHQVTGLSWLDREWSSSALGKNQSGWDWFSLQFNSGEEMMYYRMRDKQGNHQLHTDKTSNQGKWIHTDGTTTDLSSKDITLTPLEYWQAENGTRYPVSWKLVIPGRSKNLLIKAAINNQLMRTAVQYWEGSVIVYSADEQQVGQGYLEMTGY